MAVLAQNLRDAILQAAVSGKLTEQLENDSPVDNILEISEKYKKQVFIDFPRKKKIKLTPIIEEDCPDIKLPINWKFVKLGQVLTTFGRIGFRGYTTNDLVEKGKGAITLSPSNFDWFGKLTFDNNTYISWEKYEESPEIKLKDNDIVIVKTGSSYGKLAKIKDLPCETTINPQLAVLKYFDLSILDYLLVCLRSSVVQKQIEKIKKGTSIPTFPLDKFENIIIPLPPIEEQARIVAKVEEIMSKIDEYEKIENQLESIKKAFPIDMRDALLQAAMQGKLTEQLDSDSSVDDLIESIKVEHEKLVAEGKIKKSKGKSTQYNVNFVELEEDERPFKIPSTWRWSKMKDLVSISTGKKNANFGSNNGKYPFFTCAKEPIYCDSYSFEGESILMAGNGDISNISYYNGKFEAYQRTYVLQDFKTIVKPDYLYLYLTGLFVRYNQNKMFGSAIPYIKLGNLEDFPVSLPPLEEQERIVKVLNDLLPLCEAL